MWEEDRKEALKISSKSLTGWVHQETEEMIHISFYDGESFLNIYECGRLSDLYSGSTDTVYRSDDPLKVKEVAKKIMNTYPEGNVAEKTEEIERRIKD